MNTAVESKTYEFTYRGYSIVSYEADHTYSVVQNGKEYGTTDNLLQLIKDIDNQWEKFNR